MMEENLEAIVLSLVRDSFTTRPELSDWANVVALGEIIEALKKLENKFRNQIFDDLDKELQELVDDPPADMTHLEYRVNWLYGELKTPYVRGRQAGLPITISIKDNYLQIYIADTWDITDGPKVEALFDDHWHGRTQAQEHLNNPDCYYIINEWRLAK